MIMEKVISVLFLLNVLIYFVNFLLIEKNKHKVSLIVWMTIGVLFVASSNALIALLYFILKIPINLISIGIVLLALNVVAIIYLMKIKKIQKYEVSIFDGIVLIAIVLITKHFVDMQFGTSLLKLNFETSDPSVHLKNAMNVIYNRKVIGMYMTSLNEALILEAFLSFAGNLITAYRIYILFEVVMFALSGIVFYSIVREYLKKSIVMKLTFLFILLMYLIAYPLNCMVFGFGYLSFGVSIAGITILLTNMFVKSEYNKAILGVLIGMLLYGQMITYILFAPVTFLASALTIAYYYFKEKKLFTKKSILTLVGIYMVPGIIGTIYALKGIFLVNAPNAIIGLEGYAFKDLYFGFILYIPLAIGCTMGCIKRKETNMIAFANIVMIFYICVMFILGYKGKVSSYYYYKNYFVESLFLAVAFMYGAYTVIKNNVEIIISNMLLWIFLFIVFSQDIEKKIWDNNIQYNNKIVANQFFSVYEYNDKVLRKEGFSEGYLQLFAYINDLDDDKECVMVSAWPDCYWFEALTNNRTNDYTYHIAVQNDYDYLERLKEMDYIVVNRNFEAYLNNKDFFDKQDIVFENAEGFIIEMR